MKQYTFAFKQYNTGCLNQVEVSIYANNQDYALDALNNLVRMKFIWADFNEPEVDSTDTMWRYDER